MVSEKYQFFPLILSHVSYSSQQVMFLVTFSAEAYNLIFFPHVGGFVSLSHP